MIGRSQRCCPQYLRMACAFQPQTYRNRQKRNGSWTFLDEVENLAIPTDLAGAFDRYPGSWRYFRRFPDSSNRGILEWIKNAKKDATREKRVDETARLAAQNIKANHPKGRDAGPGT